MSQQLCASFLIETHFDISCTTNLLQLVVWRAALRDSIARRCSLRARAPARDVQASRSWASSGDAALPSQRVCLTVLYLIKSLFSALLMRQCWHADSRERPTFPDVVARIGHRLRKIADGRYGYVDAVNDYYVSLSLASDVFKMPYTALRRARHGGRLIRLSISKL